MHSPEQQANERTSKPRKIELSIIIPAFNESEFIRQTLLSLKTSDLPPELFEVIVVDNGSTDDTVEKARDLVDKIEVLPDVNVGAVRNYGASLASGNVLIFIDADCIVEASLLTKAYEISKHKRNTAYGGMCEVRKNANWIEEFWLLESKNRYQKDLAGACIVVHKDIFNQVGGFNEHISSGEDSNFSENLRRSGITVKVCPNLIVTHLGNASTLKDFIIRQAWHGENYFYDIKNSIKDPTFVLCILAILAAFSQLGHLILRQEAHLGSMGFFFLIPAIFSIKRLAYAKYLPKRPGSVIKIYILDLCYVVGRCTGILKSCLPAGSRAILNRIAK